MTNHLSALVSVTRGASGQLRPRPVARFEAPLAADPAGSILELDEHVDTAPLLAPRPARRPRHDLAPNHEPHRAETRFGAEPPEPGLRGPFAEVPDRRPPQPVVAAAATEVAHEQNGVPAERLPADAGSVRQVINEHETVRVERIEVLSTPPTPLPRPVVTVERQVVGVAPLRPASSVIAEHGVLNPPPLPPQPAEADRPVPAHLRPAEAGRPATAPPPAPAVTAARPDPVVQVTIGRLEIRASRPVPEERPGRGGHAPKILSLEEYGAQRGRAR
jgi:hypothetical protein